MTDDDDVNIISILQSLQQMKDPMMKDLIIIIESLAEGT